MIFPGRLLVNFLLWALSVQARFRVMVFLLSYTFLRYHLPLLNDTVK